MAKGELRKWGAEEVRKGEYGKSLRERAKAVLS
jgi:hypothetical protein